MNIWRQILSRFHIVIEFELHPSKKQNAPPKQAIYPNSIKTVVLLQSGLFIDFPRVFLYNGFVYPI